MGVEIIILSLLAGAIGGAISAGFVLWYVFERR
jgi:hypothetical protein